MNKPLALEVSSALLEDREFASRLRSETSRRRMELLVHYFTQRGIDEGDAHVLVNAFFAGAEHALLWVEHAIAVAEQA